MKEVKKRTHGFRNFMLIFLLIILLAGIGGAGYFYFYLSSFNKPLDKYSEVIKPTAVKKDEPVNVLVMGVDIGTPGAKNANDPKRTDTILLLHYDPKEGAASLISIPRDTMVEINGKKNKINAAHAIGGVNYLIDAVEKLLDIKVNYYGKVDYAGFREIVDAIGGIDMPIKYRMDYDDPAQNLHIHFKKGTTVHLDGKKAEQFFRWRENNDGTGLAEGDLGRIENQHLFISKVIDKLKSPSIIPKIPGILSTIPNYAETNMGVQDIVKYGYIMSTIDKQKLNTVTLKGDAKYVGGVSYFIYDKNKNKDILAKLHNTSDLQEGSASSDDEQIVDKSFDKSNVKLKVLNGTGKSGLAANFAELAKEKGYSNVITGNSSKTQRSKVTIYGMDSTAVSAVKEDFGIDNVELMPDNGGKSNIVVLLGKDYNQD